MQANRRQFIASAAGLALASLVPTWMLRRPAQIDLAAFCAKECYYRYDMTKPFIQESAAGFYAYGTDGKICVRVGDRTELPTTPDVKHPPASRLAWGKVNDGWNPWPAKNHLVADDQYCPVCNGSQNVCKVCGNMADPDYLCDCLSKSYWDNLLSCSTCKGRGHGSFPALQRIDHVFIDQRYDSLIRSKIGRVEYQIVPFEPLGGKPNAEGAVRFRFDRGDGMLMPLISRDSEERLAKANSK